MIKGQYIIKPVYPELPVITNSVIGFPEFKYDYEITFDDGHKLITTPEESSKAIEYYLHTRDYTSRLENIINEKETDKTKKD